MNPFVKISTNKRKTPYPLSGYGVFTLMDIEQGHLDLMEVL